MDRRMKTILFVCTGNICRSPMAEGLCRRATRDRRDLNAKSAGVGAVNGSRPSEHAIRALSEQGIDISDLRSQMLSAALVDEADYIFGMTRSHVDAITLLYPQAAEKVFLLREFDDTLDDYESDISDPIGGSYDIYARCRDQIEQGIASMLKFIDQSAADSTSGKSQHRKVSVALGADHGGWQLKEHRPAYVFSQRHADRTADRRQLHHA
jgi:protein-tyrosine-phosphatase